MLFEDILLPWGFCFDDIHGIWAMCACLQLSSEWIIKVKQSYITQAFNENYSKALIHKSTSWSLRTPIRLYASDTLEYISYHKFTSPGMCPYYTQYTECKNNDDNHMKRMSSYSLPVMIELSRERKLNDVILMQFQMKNSFLCTRSLYLWQV